MDLQAAVEASLREGFADAQLELELNGNKALVDVVSAAFAGQTRVQRSKLVYQCLESFIRSGALHAVTIRAATPEERQSAGPGLERRG